MTFPMSMSGHDRTYLPPRSLRAETGGPVTAWDLFRLERNAPTKEWASATLAALVAAADTEGAELLGCTDCQDTGFYGVADPDDQDLLTGLIRRVGNVGHQALQTSGVWQDWEPLGVPLEVLDLDLAGDLAAAITGGACGLLRRYATPKAWLPPAPVVASTTVEDVLSGLVSAGPQENTESEWVNFAVVDEVDQGAVLDLVRIRASAAEDAAELWLGSSWTSDSDVLTNANLPLVRLDDAQLSDIQEQMNPAITAGVKPTDPQACHYCKQPATKSLLHSEGMAYIPACGEHLEKATYDAEHCTPDGTEDKSNLISVRDITAALQPIVADAPLTVSPDPRAEKLRRYWTSGKGAAKIRWTAPGSGDWYRCVRHLSKYMGTRARGYCSNLHKRATGVWPGDRRNRGLRGSAVDNSVRLPSGEVLRVGDSFEMQGLKTGPYTAQVVDLETLRNRFDPQLEAHSVDVLLARGCVDDAVAILLSRSSPQPVRAELTRPWPADDSKVEYPLLDRSAMRPQHPAFSGGAFLTPSGEEVLRAKAALPDVLTAAVSAALRNNPRQAHGAAAERVAVLLPASVVSLAPATANNGPARTLVDHTLGHGFNNTLRASPEETLLASVRSRRWTGETEGNLTMTELQLVDGTYAETDDQNTGIFSTVLAGGFPVDPPDEWFDDPKLNEVTPIQVTDDGRVYGHIAPWGVTHIGMAGSVAAPRNRTGKYTYFRTGYVVTASGKKVDVGQLTLVGGHAPIGSDHASAVKHYDDTSSAMADISVGEDRYGIWAAGALRPNVTPEQIRAMRACPPSGDWRPINGNLELVAACHVNVQGFPIAKARVASGTIVALVAAGARQMAELMMARRADPVMMGKIEALTSQVAELVASAAVAEAPAVSVDEAPAETLPPEVANPAAAATTEIEEPATAEGGEEPSADELARAEKIAHVRAELEAAKRQQLRDRMQPGSGAPADVTAALPPQFLANKKKAGGNGEKDKTTIKGTDSFPIGNVADLKKAIQAFGRAGDKVAAKKHIISQAYKLKRPDLIPDGWRNSK